MKKFVLVFAVLLSGLSQAAHHMASDDMAVMAVNPWIRAMPAVAPTTGGFVTLVNHTDSDVTLKSARSALCGRIELHSHTMKNGMMVMAEVEGGITVPAKGEVQLMPGSFHLMCFNLNSPANAGDTHAVTLNFDNGQTIDMDFPVQSAPMKMEQDNSNGMHMHTH